ncbi:hypothetical protein llg_16300 [Luteolibacter sp. LG18]|nr:hypothetical protein llg_16300 [Luteolibacter sp. LG18]
MDAPERYKGVIPNGFDEVFFDPAVADGTDLPEEVRRIGGRPFLLYVSSVEPRKRTDFLLRMADRMPDVMFVAAGFVVPGMGEPYLKELCRKPNIIWLGLIEKRVLRELYRVASALFFPSEREGMPLAIIEAFGMGLPVIAQPKSSMPDLVKPGVNGELIDCSEEDTWESVCRKYLAQPISEREQFRKTIRRWAIENHSWSKVGRLYGRFYKAIRDGKVDSWQQ